MQVLSVCNIACIVVFHTRVGVAHAGLGGAGPHGGRVDGAVAEVRAVAGLAAAAGVVWAATHGEPEAGRALHVADGPTLGEHTYIHSGCDHRWITALLTAELGTQPAKCAPLSSSDLALQAPSKGMKLTMKTLHI